MSSLEISKHQIYFKQTIISVPRPMIGKTLETHLFQLRSTMSTFP